MIRTQVFRLSCTLLVTLGTAVTHAVEVDPALPGYEKESDVSGNITSVGSDTLANLMTLWAEAFKRFYPHVNIQIQAAGSSTAPPALSQGTSNLGPMSREMKSNEIEAFEAKHGYKPTPIPVAIDALAVYVHKDNPIAGLSIPQVDAIFSATRKCGAASDITTWGDLELEGDWGTRSIQLYGRNSVSGTYGYFKKNALCKGDFKDRVNEQPGSASVVQGVHQVTQRHRLLRHRLPHLRGARLVVVQKAGGRADRGNTGERRQRFVSARTLSLCLRQQTS